MLTSVGMQLQRTLSIDHLVLEHCRCVRCHHVEIELCCTSRITSSGRGWHGRWIWKCADEGKDDCYICRQTKYMMSCGIDGRQSSRSPTPGWICDWYREGMQFSEEEKKKGSTLNLYIVSTRHLREESHSSLTSFPTFEEQDQTCSPRIKL